LKLLLGLGALLVSSYIVAHSAGSIGSELGLSGTVVGTTILSLATTLPEKFVAIMGGVRRQPGIMVANTVGSNIFLVTLCGGILFLWGDAEQLHLSFGLLEAAAMLGSAVLILAIVLGGGRRWMGAVMLGLYVAFLVTEFTTGRAVVVDD
jgi:Ca2+/Na+ antiporter